MTDPRTPGEATQHGTRVLVCGDCGRQQSLDPLACRHCGSGALARVELGGYGRLYAATRIHRAPTPAFRSLVPYKLALVDMDGGARIMGHCAFDATIGDIVEASIFHHDGAHLVRFTPAGAITS